MKIIMVSLVKGWVSILNGGPQSLSISLHFLSLKMFVAQWTQSIHFQNFLPA
jgi:hypothetical protein